MASEAYKKGYKNEINYKRGNRPLNWNPRKRKAEKLEMPEDPEVIAHCTKCNDAWYAGSKQKVIGIDNGMFKVKCLECETENLWYPNREQRKNLRYPHFNGCLGQVVKSKEHEAEVAQAMGLTLADEQFY